jgi:ParB family chromosome partitioning protein
MTKRSGLGRGLSSLIPKKQKNIPPQPPLSGGERAFPPDRGGEGGLMTKRESFNTPPELKSETAGQLISEIPLKQIVANPQQPRHIFDEEALGELINSIKEHGILQPLVVSQIAHDKFEIIVGERRFRAAKEMGLETVPVIVRSVNDQQKLELALIENIQRANLNPIEEAKGYKRLTDEFDLTHEQIAKKTGKSRSQITNMIRLLDLPVRIQDALIVGEITIGHAKIIASLPSEIEQIELFKSIIRKNLNVRETERSIVKLKLGSSKFKNKPLKDPNIIEKEELLRDALSTKVNITKRGSRGKIEIEYYSEEELGSIIEKIIK